MNWSLCPKQKSTCLNGKIRTKENTSKNIRFIRRTSTYPTKGTGQVEQLKGDLVGFWSRRISKSERMIYNIEDDKVIVNVVSLKGHYSDK